MSFTSVNETIGRHRWTICALIFAATTINYLDRNVLGLLKHTLSADGVFGAGQGGPGIELLHRGDLFPDRLRGGHAAGRQDH